jgi:hypothetical protein
MRELRLGSVGEGSLSAATLALPLNTSWNAAKLPLQCDIAGVPCPASAAGLPQHTAHCRCKSAKCRCQVLLTAAAQCLHVFSMCFAAAILPQTAAASKIFQLLT